MSTVSRVPANKKESNLWQNPTTGRWHYDVVLKRTDGSVFRRGGSRKDEKAARASRDEAFAEFNNNEGRAARWTVKTWSEYVQESVWPQELAETTTDAYAYSLKNHVLPKLGGAKLDAINVPNLQEWANRLAINDSRNVAENALTVLSSLLTRAVAAGLIPGNPARPVKLRKSKPVPESKMILDENQQKALIQASVGTCMELPTLLGLKFGLRMGEALGLRWSDVDIKAGVIHVAQQAQYVKGKGVKITDPKSAYGSRSIPIAPSVLPALATAKENASHVFVCTKEGRMISAKKASRYFRFVALDAGFKDDEGGVPTHHDLRSTFLTHLANHANEGSGVKPHVLMKIAGHSNITTTMKYYIRASDTDLQAAMSCVS